MISRVTAQNPVSAEKPEIACARHRHGRYLGGFLFTRVRGPRGEQRVELGGLEPQLSYVHAEFIQLSELQRKYVFVPSCLSSRICVPATAEAAVSVAGIEADRQVWPQSSRGPAYRYGGAGGPAHHAPTMAHLVSGPSSEEGTSFASPRVCADLLSWLVSQSGSRASRNPVDLVIGAYQLNSTSLPPWKERYGYHRAL